VGLGKLSVSEEQQLLLSLKTRVYLPAVSNHLQPLTFYPDSLQEVLEKSMQQFGDKLYIKHTPILNQEGIVVACPIISHS
jgi:hypothetical protein